MTMKLGLSLRQSQHLALTPQLQQSIRLLQLSTLELSQEIEEMLVDNPFLERDDETAELERHGLEQADALVSPGERDMELPSYSNVEVAAASSDETPDAFSGADSPDWDGDGQAALSADDPEWGGDAPARMSKAGDDEERDASELFAQPPSLQDFLHTQALNLRLNQADRAALYFLIESLNEDGYLEDELEELAEGLAESGEDERELAHHHLRVALGLLQSLEPIGVGARNLSECLQLQLRAFPEQTPVVALALQLCSAHLELLARKDIKRLLEIAGVDLATLREAMNIIARLEPKPGRRFLNLEQNLVVPDVLVKASERQGNVLFQVQLNPDVMPRLRVHDLYADALRGHRGGDDSASVQGLQQRLQEARWFIKNIRQRFDTILRVSTAIVERQRGFFMHGELAMRPLVLREIAQELDLHESTISRVTTAKYMATPFGTFELKYFFGSGLGTESGSNASSTAVRALIKQFVAAESPKKPLSDNQIADMLKEQGIECARRTVAKYREALRIAPANLRKAI